MGGAPTNNIKKLLLVKIKARQDSYTDQFSRLFMVRMLLVVALLTSISWMKDQLNCLVPKSHGIDKGYVSKACWINGVYIFRDIHGGNQSYYYGIPDDFTHDGINKYHQPCATFTAAHKKVDGCKPLKKTFFLQYQWFPLAVAALGFLYYLPYVLFSVVNTDLKGMKELLSANDIQKIVRRYFDPKNNPPAKLRTRVILIVLVKLLYVVANILTFLIIDSSFNGWFAAYGSEYATWAGLSNEVAHQYFGGDPTVKAGHKLLPGFGICEVQESAQDLKNLVTNKHKVVCEMSQHVLYQYTLVVLWYVLIVGILVSILGFVYHIFDHFFNWLCFRRRGDDVTAVYKKISVRERQYLEYVRRKNLASYGDLVRAIMEDRDIRSRSSSGSFHKSDDMELM